MQTQTSHQTVYLENRQRSFIKKIHLIDGFVTAKRKKTRGKNVYLPLDPSTRCKRKIVVCEAKYYSKIERSTLSTGEKITWIKIFFPVNLKKTCIC